jgi:hypothetical protein
MTPSAYTSAAGPTNFAFPPACSGAMYAGVPITACVRVRSDERRLARPKSDTFGVRGVRRQESGVREDRTGVLADS